MLKFHILDRIFKTRWNLVSWDSSMRTFRAVQTYHQYNYKNKILKKKYFYRRKCKSNECLCQKKLENYKIIENRPAQHSKDDIWIRVAGVWSTSKQNGSGRCIDENVVDFFHELGFGRVEAYQPKIWLDSQYVEMFNAVKVLKKTNKCEPGVLCGTQRAPSPSGAGVRRLNHNVSTV